MGSEELSWIKERQREFQAKFNKILHVDWNEQLGLSSQLPPGRGETPKIQCSPEEHFQSVCMIYGTTPDQVRFPKGNLKKMSPERKALLKFAIDGYRQKWPREMIASIVNKTGTTIHYYVNNIYREEKHLIGEA